MKDANRVGAEGMPAGREVDALVAEQVFGLVRCTDPWHSQPEGSPYCHAMPDSPQHGGETRAYSTDIAAAWEVALALPHQHGLHVHLEVGDAGVICELWRVDDLLAMDGIAFEYAETAPLAICRAALAALASEPHSPE